MPQGPFGGPRPFARDKKRVLVLAGIDGELPPREIQLDLEQSIKIEVNKALGADPGEHDVNLTVEGNPTEEQRQSVGPGILHVQQYEIETPWEEIMQEDINAIHNVVVEKLDELGFNLRGTETTVI